MRSDVLKRHHRNCAVFKRESLSNATGPPSAIVATPTAVDSQSSLYSTDVIQSLPLQLPMGPLTSFSVPGVTPGCFSIPPAPHHDALDALLRKPVSSPSMCLPDVAFEQPPLLPMPGQIRYDDAPLRIPGPSDPLGPLAMPGPMADAHTDTKSVSHTVCTICDAFRDYAVTFTSKWNPTTCERRISMLRSLLLYEYPSGRTFSTLECAMSVKSWLTSPATARPSALRSLSGRVTASNVCMVSCICSV